MRLEETEKLLIEDLFLKSVEEKKIAPVLNIALEKLTGDASTRRYYRLTGDNRQYVICLDTPCVDKEYPFIVLHKVYQENHVSVPAIYDSNLSRGYLLEQDLGDQTFLRRLATVASADEELKLYEGTIKELIKINSIPLENYHGSTFQNLSFDFDKLMSECDFTLNHFIKKILNKGISNAESSIFHKDLGEICKKISCKKMVLCHRDYHSRNIMVKDDGLFVIDFQDSRKGIPQYDLVSLLDDCYYKLSENNKKILIKIYYDEMKNFLGDQSLDEFMYLYSLTMIQRVYKAIGSFAYIYNLRGDFRYLKYIGYGFEKIRTTLMEIGEFSDLRIILSRYYYEH